MTRLRIAGLIAILALLAAVFALCELQQAPFPLRDAQQAASLATSPAAAMPSAAAKEQPGTQSGSELPVVVIQADPDDLWSEDRGIYAKGYHASNKYPYEGANFWADREIPVVMTWREPDGSKGFEQQAAAKIFGGNTRTLPQKALAVSFGKKQALNYGLFPQLPGIQRFESVVLRNSGQDFAKTHFRDGLVSELVRPTGMDAQAYRPVVVYYNDLYWGIHDLREKIDADFLAAHHNLSARQIDLLESDGTVKAGGKSDFDELIALLDSSDLSKNDSYEKVKRFVDVDNFTDYILAEVYIANTDWPDHNIRYWKGEGKDSRWRWILYDTDEGFTQAQDETLIRLLAAKKSKKTDKPKHVAPYILSKLLQNDSYQALFLERWAYHMNVTFEPGHVKTVIDGIERQLLPEMPRHLNKWGGTLPEWRAHVNELRQFAEQRPKAMKEQIKQIFGLTDEDISKLGVKPE